MNKRLTDSLKSILKSFECEFGKHFFLKKVKCDNFMR